MKWWLTMFIVYFFCCSCFANEYVLSNESNPEITKKESVRIYEQQIEKRESEGSRGKNKTGIVWGGVFTGVGSLFLGFGIYAFASNYHTESSGDVAGRMIGGLSMIVSIPFLAVGIPVLSYNIYQYNDWEDHTKKRDEYQRSLDSCRRKDSGSMRIMLLPSLDFINSGGGLSLLAQF